MRLNTSNTLITGLNPNEGMNVSPVSAVPSSEESYLTLKDPWFQAEFWIATTQSTLCIKPDEESEIVIHW
jgi:hypothetical protein